MNIDACPSPLLILNCVEIPYKWNLFQRNHLDVNEVRSEQRVRKQKVPGAGAKPCWCLSCFHTMAHSPLVQQKSRSLPWQEKTVPVSNRRSWASGNCSQLHYPKLLHLFLLPSPLPVSLYIYTHTVDFVGHCTIQNILLGERFFWLHFWWKCSWSVGWALLFQKRRD